jgi:hypothetical protein
MSVVHVVMSACLMMMYVYWRNMCCWMIVLGLCRSSLLPWRGYVSERIVGECDGRDDGGVAVAIVKNSSTEDTTYRDG